MVICEYYENGCPMDLLKGYITERDYKQFVKSVCTSSQEAVIQDPKYHNGDLVSITCPLLDLLEDKRNLDDVLEDLPAFVRKNAERLKNQKNKKNK